MDVLWENSPPPALTDIKALATYNAEVARGIVHTKAWDLRMGELQRYFNSQFATPALYIEHNTPKKSWLFNLFRRD